MVQVSRRQEPGRNAAWSRARCPMSIVKVAIEGAAKSELYPDLKDPRLLPLTTRHKPQNRKKPNETLMNWGMEDEPSKSSRILTQ